MLLFFLQDFESICVQLDNIASFAEERKKWFVCVYICQDIKPFLLAHLGFPVTASSSYWHNPILKRTLLRTASCCLELVWIDWKTRSHNHLKSNSEFLSKHFFFLFFPRLLHQYWKGHTVVIISVGIILSTSFSPDRTKSSLFLSYICISI